MSDTRSQLEEIDALIAAEPNDPALQQLREDLLQLIALEEQEQEGQTAEQQQQQPLSEDAAAAESYPLGAVEADYTQQSKHHADSAAASSESSGQQHPSYRRVVRVIILLHDVSGSNSAAMRLVALVTPLS